MKYTTHSWKNDRIIFFREKRKPSRNKMEAPGKVKFGSTFKGESQDVNVNCKAERVRDDAWEVGVFTVGFGENWYYAPLKHEVRLEDDATKTEQYLIHDNVGHDGWGEITIFRNIEWVDDKLPNVIQLLDDFPTW